MVDKPETTYLVSVFEKPHWRTVLTTKDKQKAFDTAKGSGNECGAGDHTESQEALGSVDSYLTLELKRRRYDGDRAARQPRNGAAHVAAAIVVDAVKPPTALDLWNIPPRPAFHIGSVDAARIFWIVHFLRPAVETSHDQQPA
ncbi:MULTISPECIES: hypothetical protein [unclassified Mesorhizobium]|uniref:hypothetical protein n=1 Tax=unclassified Mesorhizobium TaxID=325217 RepID=UPI0015C7796A|nr:MULTISPECIES: hypothetical protein [unclassified Mesorhizobium]